MDLNDRVYRLCKYRQMKRDLIRPECDSCPSIVGQCAPCAEVTQEIHPKYFARPMMLLEAVPMSIVIQWSHHSDAL